MSSLSHNIPVTLFPASTDRTVRSDRSQAVHVMCCPSSSVQQSLFKQGLILKIVLHDWWSVWSSEFRVRRVDLALFTQRVLERSDYRRFCVVRFVSGEAFFSIEIRIYIACLL